MCGPREPATPAKEQPAGVGLKLETTERLLYVALFGIAAAGITVASGWFYPGDGNIGEVSTRVGGFATVVALLGFAGQAVHRIWLPKALRWGWAMAGIEGAGLMLAVVALFLPL